MTFCSCIDLVYFHTANVNVGTWFTQSYVNLEILVTIETTTEYKYSSIHRLRNHLIV